MSNGAKVFAGLLQAVQVGGECIRLFTRHSQADLKITRVQEYDHEIIRIYVYGCISLKPGLKKHHERSSGVILGTARLPGFPLISVFVYNSSANRKDELRDSLHFCATSLIL